CRPTTTPAPDAAPGGSASGRWPRRVRRTRARPAGWTGRVPTPCPSCSLRPTRATCGRSGTTTTDTPTNMRLAAVGTASRARTT
ncbi:MAG: hypothetical protein AVDCRST_MAG73-1761, partial [uncultured Thermomicrobiales bacterium]